MTKRSGDQGRIPATVQNAVIAAYYPDAVRGATAARTRAQAAQSVASVFATALVAALGFSDAVQRDLLVRIATALSVAAWSVAAVLYMRAIGSPTRLTSAEAEVNSADAAVDQILEMARSERQGVDERQHQANIAAVVALALTFGSVSLALFVPRSPEWRAATVTPGVGDQLSIELTCPSVSWPAKGQVDEATVGTGMVSVELTCSGTAHRYALREGTLISLVLGQ